MIRVSGSQAIWELKVETPDGTRESVTTLYGEDGIQPSNKLLLELGRLAKRISEIVKVRSSYF